MDIGSMMAPVSARSCMMICDSARYRSMRGGTKMAVGHKRPAVALGMAERTPNLRAS